MDVDQARPLFFVHVMKTGGSSFRSVIADNVSAARTYPNAHDDPDTSAYWSIESLRDLPAERRRRTSVFCGHFPFVVTELVGPATTTVSIVRDPVARTISHLHHRRHHDPGSRSLPLERIYEDPLFSPLLIRNHQAKVFAMTRNDPLESFMDVIDVDEERLAVAQANLDRLDILGLQEHHEEFLEEVAGRLGWRIRAIRLRHGVPTPSEVPGSFRRRIADDNAMDMAFYEHARSVHGRRRSRSLQK